MLLTIARCTNIDIHIHTHTHTHTILGGSARQSNSIRMKRSQQEQEKLQQGDPCERGKAVLGVHVYGYV